jgi:hypothetical protein
MLAWMPADVRCWRGTPQQVQSPGVVQTGGREWGVQMAMAEAHSTVRPKRKTAKTKQKTKKQKMQDCFPC